MAKQKKKSVKRQPGGKGVTSSGAKKRRTVKAVSKKGAQGAARSRRKGAPRFTKSELKKYRDMLLAHKERIAGDITALRNTHLRSSQRDSTGDLSGYSLHMADVGTDTYDREFGISVASSEQNIIYRIDLAIKRIEEKTYGLCEECSRKIKITRLKAVPWARLCIACKEAEETEERGS